MTDEIKTIQLKNGTLQDARSGKFLPGAIPTTAITTSERGRELANLRHEKTRDAVRAAVMETVKSLTHLPITTPEDAYAYVVAQQTAVLAAAQKPKMDDVEKLGELMGLVFTKQEAAIMAQPEPPKYVPISAEVIRLLRLVKEAQEKAAIEQGKLIAVFPAPPIDDDEDENND